MYIFKNFNKPYQWYIINIHVVLLYSTSIFTRSMFRKRSFPLFVLII